MTKTQTPKVTDWKRASKAEDHWCKLVGLDHAADGADV